MMAYLRPMSHSKLLPLKPLDADKQISIDVSVNIDRTPKNYVGGKQARPDGSSVMPVISPSGKLVGEAGRGNRKDIRNAVEAAAKHAGWSTSTAHLRAQIIYYIGENLDARKEEFAARIKSMTGASISKARAEVELSISRLFYYAGFADKFDGAVHSPPMRDIAIAMNETSWHFGNSGAARGPFARLYFLDGSCYRVG